MEKCWTRDARLRPSFDNIVQLLQTAKSIRPDPRSRSSCVMQSEGLGLPRSRTVFQADSRQAVREAAHRQYSLPAPPPTSNSESMPSFHSRRGQQGLSTVSGPPAYEVASDLHHATSAPPSITQFRLMDTVAGQPDMYSTTADLHRKEGDEDLRLMFNNSLRLQSTDMPWMDRRVLAPALSISTTSSSSGEYFAPRSHTSSELTITGSSIGPSASLRTSSSGESSIPHSYAPR
ncbi:hypothetical protein C8R43DRAFT_268833 [Mycena crocata]|nr:hypothetical protein C8R43DRAFT_268833 [Mycena crocata]